MGAFLVFPKVLGSGLLFEMGFEREGRAFGRGSGGGLLLCGGASVDVANWEESCVDCMTGREGSGPSSSAGISYWFNSEAI